MVSCAPAYDDRHGSYAYGEAVSAGEPPHNYVCRGGFVSLFCGMSAFAPGTLYSNRAWIREDEPCSGPAATVDRLAPAPWGGGGCPGAFSAGAGYAAGDLVSVPNPHVAGDLASVPRAGAAMVYRCRAGTAEFCGMHGYAPGHDIHWEHAWTALGSCAPAPADGSSSDYSYDSKSDKSPDYYYSYYKSSDYSYSKSAKLSDYYYSKSEMSAPVDGCPGVPEAGGARPAAWEAKDHVYVSDSYRQGDLVASAEGYVYECRGWPYSNLCGQAGYEPPVDPATPGAWKAAWVGVGRCATVPPTEDPS